MKAPLSKRAYEIMHDPEARKQFEELIRTGREGEIRLGEKIYVLRRSKPVSLNGRT